MKPIAAVKNKLSTSNLSTITGTPDKVLPEGENYKHTGPVPTTNVKISDDSKSFPVKDPHKITRIRCWWNKRHIVGMEVYYNNYSAGSRLGTKTKDMQESILALEPHELVTAIRGSLDTSINFLQVALSSGRVFTFGEEDQTEIQPEIGEEVKVLSKKNKGKTGGGGFQVEPKAVVKIKKFSFSKEGLVIRSFKMGTDNYLKYLGVYFGEPYFSELRKLVKLGVTISNQDSINIDSIIHDDNENLTKGALRRQIRELQIFYSASYVYGLKVIYDINHIDTMEIEHYSHNMKAPYNKSITIEDDEYIAHINGYEDETGILQLKFITNFGQVLVGGSDDSEGFFFERDFKEGKVLALYSVSEDVMKSLSVYVA